MDEESEEGNNSVVAFSRHRSPTFTKEETKALLNGIDLYKSTILNKSTSAAASLAKEAAWEKIAKYYNSQGFKYGRSANCLKTKWDNLKKEARKLSKNLIDVRYDEFDELLNQVVNMMSEAENNTSATDVHQDVEGGLNDRNEEKKSNDSITFFPSWDNCETKHLENTSDDDNDDDHDRGRRLNRALNFLPYECSLLLQCVKEEKKHILSKETTSKAVKLKNRAWSRVTESFNKLSPQKRSTKVLRRKFSNMKVMAKNVNFKNYFKSDGNKHERLVTENAKRIKSEPPLEEDQPLNDDDNMDFDNLHKSDNTQINNFAPDPLSTVLNSDSGIEVTVPGPGGPWENKEIIKLKIELLNYQMETAKLKRKRIEDAIKAEAAEQNSRAIERALRLRAARLDVVAAEAKLPAQHPALMYTADEAGVKHYMNQYQQ